MERILPEEQAAQYGYRRCVAEYSSIGTVAAHTAERLCRYQYFGHGSVNLKSGSELGPDQSAWT